MANLSASFLVRKLSVVQFSSFYRTRSLTSTIHHAHTPNVLYKSATFFALIFPFLNNEFMTLRNSLSSSGNNNRKTPRCITGRESEIVILFSKYGLAQQKHFPVTGQNLSRHPQNARNGGTQPEYRE